MGNNMTNDGNSKMNNNELYVTHYKQDFVVRPRMDEAHKFYVDIFKLRDDKTEEFLFTEDEKGYSYGEVLTDRASDEQKEIIDYFISERLENTSLDIASGKYDPRLKLKNKARNIMGINFNIGHGGRKFHIQSEVTNMMNVDNEDPDKRNIETMVYFYEGDLKGVSVYSSRVNYCFTYPTSKETIAGHVIEGVRGLMQDHFKTIAKCLRKGHLDDIIRERVEAVANKNGDGKNKVELDWDNFSRDVEGNGSKVYTNPRNTEEEFVSESELKRFEDEDKKKGYWFLTCVPNGDGKIFSEFRKVGGIEEFLEEELDYDPRVKINLANYDMERFHKSTFEKLKSKYGLVEDESDLSGTAIDSFADFSGRETQIDSPVYVPRAPIVEDDEDTQPDYVAEQKKKTIAKLRELTKDISPEHDNSVITDFEIEDDPLTDFIKIVN